VSVETDFRAAMTSYTAISDLISSRLYAVLLPVDVIYPAIAYSHISTVPNGSGGCQLTRLQVDCYDSAHATVRSMRDAVVALADSRSDYDYVVGPDFYEEDDQLYHRVVDVFISHS